MDLVIQILISLATSIFVVIVYYLLRRRGTNNKSYDRFFQLENQIADLQAKVNSLQKQSTLTMNSPSFVPQQTQIISNQRIKDDYIDKNNKQKQSIKNVAQNTSRQQEQDDVKPIDANCFYLSVSEGRLVEVSSGQASYYRAWKHKGKIFFEFFCDPQKVKKAINNRSAIIDPCCIKSDSSIEPDIASKIITIRHGELDNNFNILTKVTIKFS